MAEISLDDLKTTWRTLVRLCLNYWAVVGIGFLFFILVVFPELLTADFWAEKILDSGGRVIQKSYAPARLILLPVGVIALAFAIWRSMAAHRQAIAALKQSQIAAEQFAHATKSLAVDRYAKAAEMLSSDRAVTREAGVIALGELARSDSSYLVLVEELLRTFASERGAEHKKASDGDKLKDDDVAHAIEVFGGLHLIRRGLKIPKEKRSYDFYDTCMRQKSFYDLSLDNVWFTDCRFEFVSFHRCTLTNVFFWNGELEGVTIANSDCTHMQFSHYSGAPQISFQNCKLTDANFGGLDCERVQFEIVNLSGVKSSLVSNLRSENVKSCWAWADDRPELPEGVALVNFFDPGVEGINRSQFAVSNSHSMPPETLRVR